MALNGTEMGFYFKGNEFSFTSFAFCFFIRPYLGRSDRIGILEIEIFGDTSVAR